MYWTKMHWKNLAGHCWPCFSMDVNNLNMVIYVPGSVYFDKKTLKCFVVVPLPWQMVFWMELNSSTTLKESQPRISPLKIMAISPSGIGVVIWSKTWQVCGKNKQWLSMDIHKSKMLPLSCTHVKWTFTIYFQQTHFPPFETNGIFHKTTYN